jgi:hypothetical protein
LLVDDLRAIENHTADPTGADPASLSNDDSRLRTDLAAALALQPSPDSTVRPAWSAALSYLAQGDRTLRAASTNPDPAIVALAHQQFEIAGNSLVRIGQAITPGA